MLNKMNLIKILNCNKLLNLKQKNLLSLVKKNYGNDSKPGVEQVQYIMFKRKPIIKKDSDNLLVLEDDKMLSVYLSKKIARKQNTDKNPIYVPAIENKRMICCHCDLDGFDLTYTVLEKNKTTKCQCGYYFKLVDHIEPFSRRV